MIGSKVCPNYFCCLVCFSTLLFINLLYLFVLRRFFSPLLLALASLSVINAVISYAVLALSDPGIAEFPSKGEEYMAEAVCPKCGREKGPSTVHCYECQVCVLGHDHHCPFVGKCVGSNNLRLYYYFIGSNYANAVVLSAIAFFSLS